jgi:hypothetical protein
MWEEELDFEHALNSVNLVCDIRSILNSAPEGRIEWSNEAALLINRIVEIIRHTPEYYQPAEWLIMAAALRVLASQNLCLSIAHGGTGDLIKERAKCDVLVDELRRLLFSNDLLLPSMDLEHYPFLQTGQCDAEKLRRFLLMLPLKTLYWHLKEVNISNQQSAENFRTASPLLRVIIFLDHAPMASPQLLKSSILYPLVFRVRGLVWPDEAVRLRLDLLTTCPASAFSVSEFILERPLYIDNNEYCGELKGQIIFNSGQSSLLDDIVFTVRGAFESADGDFTEIPVIGHNELCFRVTNEELHPLLTGNRPLDRHIEELVTKLLKDCPSVRSELPELLGMLQALTRLLATYAQGAIYKGRNDVLESEFQEKVIGDLRLVLGQEVQEHPAQAGGSTDIRYRGVIVELKVEKKNGDRGCISKKYTPQAAQYAGVEARQVSILLVLDLTNKDMPPGDIRNDILLTDVKTHGGESEVKQFPSRAFVFVVNGNMKSPSTYSR